MSLSEIFIYRPIATSLLAIGLALSGMIAFKFLPVSVLPQIEFPTINIQASLPGASPSTMGNSIATPLERQLGKIAGITEMTSSSTLGSTRITIQFDLSRDINGAARDVQAAINAARSQLPIDMPSQPTYRKVNPADAPIMLMALTSDMHTTGQLYDTASTILAQKLSQIEGIGQVLVGGSSLPGVRVELEPKSLTKYGISLEQVRTVLTSSNVNRPKGQIDSAGQTNEIVTNDQIFKAINYRPLIVSYKNGAAVKLSDIAEIMDSVENLRNAGLSDGKPAVILVFFKQPGANVIETVDRVYEIMPILKASIPGNTDLTIMLDQTKTIRASLIDIETTLIISIGLVVWVMYLFLRNARAALIPSVTVPLSLLGTFCIMYLFDFTLNNLSLMALTIATGFVVDDSVVVLENISRHIENGLKPLQAALQGAKEVSFTVLSMSLSLVAVFIPILLMQGIAGRLFREFALTLSIAIIVSLIVSLTVTPMLCARILKIETKVEHEKTHRSFIYKIRDKYSTSLVWSLNHPRLILALTILTILITLCLYVYIPKGFFPQQDTGRINGSIQAQQNISFQSMKEKLSAFVEIVGEDPAVQSVTAFVGSGGSKTSNTGNMYITLKPLKQRKISSDEVIGRLRNKLSKVPAASLYLSASQDLVIGGRQSNAQYIYALSAFDLDTLNTWVPQFMAKFSALPGVLDLNNDQLDKGMQVYLTIDRDKAALYGISSENIDNTLYDAFGQRQVSVMYTTLNQYHVVMEVAPQYWQNPETLNHIYLTSSAGEQVPLATFAKFDTSPTLLQVSHQGQFPAATLSFNLAPGVALSDVVELINDAVDGMNLPEGSIYGSFEGTAKAFQASISGTPFLIIAALVAVYIVLGILYESTLHPITILSTLPSAGVGALVALILTHTQLTLISLIGIILLIGIVKKNAIMMIDFALMLKRTSEKTPNEAIFEACILRFRPIMMTTMAALLSVVPLALDTGVGSELRRPLGVAIIGGLIFSQILTLYTTPVIYLTFENWSQLTSALWQKYFHKKNPPDLSKSTS